MQTTQVNKGWDVQISMLRTMAMMIIVLYHCLCFNTGIWNPTDNVYYSPAMVAVVNNLRYVGLFIFVFISGVLYYRHAAAGKYNDLRRFVMNKANRLLVPYLVWGVLLCVIFWGREQPAKLWTGISHLWFLLMLFDVFLVVGLFKNVWRKLEGWQIAAVFLLLICVQAVFGKMGVDLNHTSLCWGRALIYLPVFYLGMMTERAQWWHLSLPSKASCYACIVALFLVGCVFFLRYFHLSLFYQWLPVYVIAIIIYIGCNAKSTHMGGVLDKYSLSIYIIHHILIFVGLDYLPIVKIILMHHPYAGPLLMFTVVLPLSLILSMLIDRLPGSKYIIGI